MDERKKYLGGTDCGAILGLSKWKTPIEVWAEKTGTVQPEDISEKMAVKLGTRLEQTVAELFCEQTGKKVHRINDTVYHPLYPFIAANIDRKVEGENSLLECKTASAYRSREWDGDEIPAEYIMQVYHYLAVTGYAKAYLAVLIGNTELIVRELLYDKSVCDNIIAKECAFWNNHVVPNVMPSHVTQYDDDILAKLYPTATPSTEVALPDAAARIIESVESMSQDAKSIDAEIKKLKNELKTMIKDNEVGYTATHRVKWSNVHKDEFTVKASDYRMLRYAKIKTEEK